MKKIFLDSIEILKVCAIEIVTSWFSKGDVKSYYEPTRRLTIGRKSDIRPPKWENLKGKAFCIFPEKNHKYKYLGTAAKKH